jgi:hypothetical protein
MLTLEADSWRSLMKWYSQPVSALAEATQTDKRTAGVFLDTLSALAYKEIKKNGEFVLAGLTAGSARVSIFAPYAVKAAFRVGDRYISWINSLARP